MDKVLEVQQQVKNNAADLNDYLRDLDSWTKQMETKDEQLKQAKKNKKTQNNSSQNTSSSKSNSKDVKEVLNRELKKESSTPPKKPKKEIVISNSKPSKSVKPRDYSEWDKFDVDAACEEAEESSDDDEEDLNEQEEIEDEMKKVEAVAEKERGNDLFKKGEYDKAIERYTRGMNLDPRNAMLPANRAMALLKKYQYGAAETDCTLALSIDDTYVKAFQRRASARTGLGKYELAIEDYDKVLKYEPSNKAALNEKTKLVEKIKNIKEVNGNTEKDKPNFNKFDDKMKGAFKSINLDQKKPSSSRNLEPGRVFPIEKPAHLRSTKPLKRIEIEEVASMKPQTSGNTVIKQINGNVSKSTGLTKKIEKEISTDLSKVEIVSTLPPVPKTSSKFLTDWKSIKTIVNRSKYLQQFKALDYTTVFKSSLDGVVFSEICCVLHHMVQRGVMPDIVVDQMNGLSSLPRVAAIAMFASKQDVDKLRYVVDELDIASPTDKEKWTKTFHLK